MKTKLFITNVRIIITRGEICIGIQNILKPYNSQWRHFLSWSWVSPHYIGLLYHGTLFTLNITDHFRKTHEPFTNNCQTCIHPNATHHATPSHTLPSPHTYHTVHLKLNTPGTDTKQTNLIPFGRQNTIASLTPMFLPVHWGGTGRALSWESWGTPHQTHASHSPHTPRICVPHPHSAHWLSSLKHYEQTRNKRTINKTNHNYNRL